MKSLIINEEILEKNDLSIDELLWLYKKRIDESFKIRFSMNNSIKLIELEDKGFIKITKDFDTLEFELRQKAIDILDLFTIDIEIDQINNKIIKKSSRKVNSEIDNYLEEYRRKWKGVKVGAMGSLNACRTKLERWLKENPSYSMLDVLKAADIYLQTETNPRFIQRADYFIYKQEKGGESSRLSAYVDEIEGFKEDGWTNTLN